MKNHIFICFEGVDGSGKTTLAKLLAEDLHAQYYYSPPEILLSIRSQIQRYDLAVRFQYYLLGNFIASEEVKKMVKKTPVVVDRYVYSTLVFHLPMMSKEMSEILLPDHIVHVTASWDTIEHRLSQRANRQKGEELPYLQAVAQQYERLFSGLNNVISIDTTSETPLASLRRIKDRLRR